MQEVIVTPTRISRMIESGKIPLRPVKAERSFQSFIRIESEN